MKKNFLHLLAALAFLAAASCKPENNESDPGQFTVEPTVITADYEGGSKSVIITTNKDWNLVPEQDYDWITYSKKSGSGNDNVLLTFAPNTTEERQAKISVTATGFDPITISIVQEAPKSQMRLGQPYIDKAPVKDVEGSIVIKVPYVNALGTESVQFSMTFSGAASEGLSSQTYTCNTFTQGEGAVEIPVNGTPTLLGLLSVTVEAYGDAFEPVDIRVIENVTYEKYINWNHYAAGWTRNECNLLRGSQYDYSWTSEALHPTESGVGTDHKVLVTRTNLPGCEEAYLSLVCANSIVAAGQASGPSGTPPGLAGYQFNPGYQVQGMVKDDYVFVYIPKVSLAAGSTITLESSIGGAKAASNVFIVEYSTDNSTWTAFGDILTLEVSGTSYDYHYQYLTANSDKRYVYARDSEADPAYRVIHATVPSAVDGQLYIRFRSLGINGAAAVQTGIGWGDIKFIDIHFD